MDESNIKITVKFTTRSMPITVSHDSTVQSLKTLLLPLTSILPRGQTLIFKGRILENDKSLRESGIVNGARIMLVGSKGLHQGDGPKMGEAPSRIISRKTNVVNEKKEFKADKSRTERWKATNIVALAECNLKDIPDEVWPCAPFIRILDISHNFIQYVPDRIDCLTGLRKLSLDGNGLSDESINWQGLTSLKLLQVLSLSQNCLNTVPSTLGLLTSLQQLHVANNKLTALPIEIGNLTELEVLKVNNNRISSIPSNIGNCTSLIEVDLSSNHLSELPEGFCSLHNLKALHLSNNAMTSLPNSLFRMCTQLSTLDLHNTEITMDTLRQCEGWEDFDERRRAKHQKQIDFRVMNSAEFDEGADKN
ncbi:LRR repeats and ubiquitin-like domain-containing protein At2g30105 [Pistacia vera]|uniref:LRR repeats and ubiquitin-like domain-containing protein At2g30105 n=1 Tax=Pistacia vera TaxID=55513 RepID=UPI00126367EF|nr:LRR repeats and ubiquitin-like domain-containing protein At2g30105 [Pistacia vera]